MKLQIKRGIAIALCVMTAITYCQIVPTADAAHAAEQKEIAAAGTAAVPTIKDKRTSKDGVSLLQYDEASGEVEVTWKGAARKLVVELYEDKAQTADNYDGIKLLESKEKSVSPSDEDVSERITFTSIPAYFVLKAYIVNSKGKRIGDDNEHYLYT